ncbi:phenylalanine--tRNA ligase subunit beta [Candidatus Fermentibacteria bacterium]|nr:phenylalanine--tRNA ligase subunit beta [Candidatus Fermentibacteria bacterium]
MPVVGIPIHRLNDLLGRPVPADELVRALQRMGSDIEGFGTVRRFKCSRCGFVLERTATEADPGYCEDCQNDFSSPGSVLPLPPVEVVRLDLLAVRPDMFDVGGLARALRAYLDISPGLAAYDLASPCVRVDVHPGLDGPGCFRPAIGCAVVRDVQLDDDLLKELMRLQENLHWALGRDRRRASVGVYDLATVTPPITYRTVDPDGPPFRALGWPNELTPRQILQEHPKGRAFGHALADFQRYPLLIDACGQVLSMPPIINSEESKVTAASRDLFIDVTGPRVEAVSRCLNVMVTSILEFSPGSRGEHVEIIGPDGKRCLTPDLTPQEMILDMAATRRVLGINLSDDDAPGLLARMGHQTEWAGPSSLRVLIPSYRPDFLHQRDLMEEVAIAFGYDKITPALVPTMTVGQPHPDEERAAAYRRALAGLGHVEVMTLLLGSPETHYGPFGLPVPEECMLIANPISTEQTLGRTWILPGLIDTVARNTSREMPHRLFEVGTVLRVDPEAETGVAQHTRAGVVLAGPGIGFADIRSVMDALIRETGQQLMVRPLSKPYFIQGRAAEILDQNGTVMGEMGEIHPSVLEHFKVIQPVAAAEIAVR